VGSGQGAQSFAQLLGRVGCRATGVQDRSHLGIRDTKSVLICNHGFFECTRLLTDSGCEVGRGRRLFGERSEKMSAEYIEYLSRINGSDDRVAPPR
jgi:hypothetical protein